jgi:hypothetical protein
MFSNHVTKDFSAYCQGELSSEESRRFAEHIISCTKCRSKFEEVKLGVKLAEQLPRLAAPDHLWEEIETLRARQSPSPTQFVTVFTKWKPQVVGIAAIVLLAIALVILWNYRNRPTSSVGPSWRVARLGGTPKIGSAGISNGGQLGVGQWLETDSTSSAEISVASIGQVQIDPNTRVRLVDTQPTEHRLELARGKMSARIWAPPRLFFVDTPSAVAADLGCAYTLEVDDAGSSLLRVTFGWVALELKDRESMVPSGAACQTRPGIGPGTPYFEDASADFRQLLAQLDFDSSLSAVQRTDALGRLLSQSRARDTLTLWHLLGRVDGADRELVYNRIAGLVPPPAGVTREGVLELNQQMLEQWRDKLEDSWTRGSTVVPKAVAETWWKLRNGVDRRVQKPEGK